MQAFIEMKVLEQKSIFTILSTKYRKDEESLQAILDKINMYRFKPSFGDALISKNIHHKSLRRSIVMNFPFMAKL